MKMKEIGVMGGGVGEYVTSAVKDRVAQYRYHSVQVLVCMDDPFCTFTRQKIFISIPLEDPSGGGVGALGMRAPFLVQFHAFSCSFRQNICQVIDQGPTAEVVALLSGKSWVRH